MSKVVSMSTVLPGPPAEKRGHSIARGQRPKLCQSCVKCHLFYLDLLMRCEEVDEPEGRDPSRVKCQLFYLDLLLRGEEVEEPEQRAVTKVVSMSTVLPGPPAERRGRR